MERLKNEINHWVISLIDKNLLDILACPLCKVGVRYDKRKNSLTCNKCKRSYPIKNDIPVMLAEE
jgi:hypothetical protein